MVKMFTCGNHGNLQNIIDLFELWSLHCNVQFHEGLPVTGYCTNKMYPFYSDSVWFI